MTIPNAYFPIITYNEIDYSLAFWCAPKYTYIKMTLNGANLLTSDFNATIPVLTKHLPQIFESTCYNDFGLPFCDEVRDTELGHLFEHIMLEYLCQYSTKGGDVMFRGETRWNWKIDPRGVFHIYVSATAFEVYAFKKAMQKAIELINKIIAESVVKPTPVYVPNKSN